MILVSFHSSITANNQWHLVWHLSWHQVIMQTINRLHFTNSCDTLWLAGASKIYTVKLSLKVKPWWPLRGSLKMPGQHAWCYVMLFQVASGGQNKQFSVTEWQVLWLFFEQSILKENPLFTQINFLKKKNLSFKSRFLIAHPVACAE